MNINKNGIVLAFLKTTKVTKNKKNLGNSLSQWPGEAWLKDVTQLLQGNMAQGKDLR